MKAARIGVVCGLKDEAATLPNDPRITVVCVAGDGARAYAEALRLADSGAALLMSYGTAAGLAPDLRPGAVVCADPLRFGADARADFRVGDIVGVDRPLTTAAQKAALWKASGALAADMETAGVAQAAHECGLPLIRLRAVSDDAGMAAPACALAGLRADGSTAAWPVLAGLARRPRDLPALLRLARGYRAALAALRGFRPRVLGLLG